MEGSKLITAMAAARAKMGTVQKTGENKFHKYNYADLHDILKVVEGPMEENGLVAMSSVEEVISQETRTTKGGGTEYSVLVKLKTTIMHTSGESQSIYSWGEGQDGGDKAVYKATTGARKYALTCLFNLATSDDPEADSHESAKPPQKKSGTHAPAKPRNGDSFNFLWNKLEACKTNEEVHQFGLDYKVSINALPDAEKAQIVTRAKAMQHGEAA